MKLDSRLGKEDGAALVVALIFLVLLTLLGISITTTSEIEIQIAGNERRYKQNLYRAEAATMESAQIMEEQASLSSDDYAWLLGFGSPPTPLQLRTNNYWDGDVDDDTDDLGQTVSVNADPDGKTRYLAVEEGIAEGTSLDMTKTSVHEYTIYGRRYDHDNPNTGRSIVKVGYRKAF